MAKIFTDILLDENFNPIIRDGDFVIGESIDQEVDMITAMSPGQNRRHGLMGPALFRFVNAPTQAEELEGVIKLHLAMDGKRAKVRVENNEMYTDAEQE